MTANVMYVKILKARFPLVSRILKESTVNAKFAAKVSLSEPTSAQIDFSSNIRIFLLTFKQKNLVEDLCHAKLTIGLYAMWFIVSQIGTGHFSLQKVMI